MKLRTALYNGHTELATIEDLQNAGPGGGATITASAGDLLVGDGAGNAVAFSAATGAIVFVDGSGHAATSADLTFVGGDLTVGAGGRIVASGVVADAVTLNESGFINQTLSEYPGTPLQLISANYSGGEGQLVFAGSSWGIDLNTQAVIGQGDFGKYRQSIGNAYLSSALVGSAPTIDNESVAGATLANVEIAGTLANVPVVPGSVFFTTTGGGGRQAHDNGLGVIVSTHLGSGGTATIDYTTGVFSFSFDGNISTAKATYGYPVPVNGTVYATAYSVGGTPGLVTFSGLVTSITVVNGIVTAAS